MTARSRTRYTDPLRAACASIEFSTIASRPWLTDDARWFRVSPFEARHRCGDQDADCWCNVLLGTSPVMQSLSRRIERLAMTERTVLLSGDTGTGKELVARTLHQRSQRRDQTFVTINCGSLPEQVVESELFGHTKGAFTGAGSSRRGLLRSAHKGTLLLDEVNSMSLDAQARLLRFLETGELRAVGSDAPQTVDTWIIAATNTDLRRAAETGAFRKDLMYRLDYLRLDVPPLRCRGDDVKLLAQHFLRNISGTAVDFSEGAYAAIADYDWPGNVRELRNRVEAAALMVDKPVITEEDLALPATQHPCVASPYGLSDRLWELVQDSGMSLGEAIAFCEELLIREALDREENNRTRAAHRLRIHVRTIFKKLAPSCARTPGARPPKDPPGAP